MLDEQIASERYYSYDDAMLLLEKMGKRKITDVYPVVRKVDFCTELEDSDLKRMPSARPRTKPVIRCRIGIRELFENQVDGMVRDVDLVWAGKHIMHEAWHLRQMTDTYQQKDLSGRDLDMARMDAIAEVFQGYSHGSYGHRPSEVDADIYGFGDVVNYFDNHIVGGDGKPLLDAKACLTVRVHELPMWRGVRQP